MKRRLGVVTLAAMGCLSNVWADGTNVAVEAVKSAPADQALTKQEDKAVTTGKVSLDAFTAYVFRGAVLNNGGVLQPSLTVNTPISLYFNVWGNMNMGNRDKGQWEFNEWDFLVAYPLKLGQWVTVEAGVIEYDYPKQGRIIEKDGELLLEHYDTREGYFQVTGDMFLSPTVKVYYDFDEISGFYGYAGVSHDHHLTEKLSLGGSLKIGMASPRYNNYCYEVEATALNDMTIFLSLAYALTDAVSFGLYGAYSAMLDGSVARGAEDFYGHRDMFYGGLNGTYSF